MHLRSTQNGIALRRSSGAMSLVEMLIALGIVTVLAAMLFPAASKFRERSKTAKCANNLRIIGGAVFANASDNNGALVCAFPVGDLTHWLNILEPYLGGTSTNYDTGKRPAWQLCPSKVYKSPDRFSVGYGWNYLYFGLVPEGKDDWDSGSSGGGTRLGSIASPSQTIIVADSNDIKDPNNANGQPNILFYGSGRWCADSFARRHEGHGNYLFADGHVETLTPEQAWRDDDYLIKKFKPELK